jgi:hypothetical protein
VADGAVQQKVDGRLYTGVYGVLDSELPAAQTGLTQVQTTMPINDVGTHYSYAGQWLLFALIGFVALGLAMRKEYRRLNIDDPEERVRASKRMRKRASPPFTDEELEDESIGGYIPLTRWGTFAGSASRTSSLRRTISPGARTDATNGAGASTREISEPPTIYVIRAPLDSDEFPNLYGGLSAWSQHADCCGQASRCALSWWGCLRRRRGSCRARSTG